MESPVTTNGLSDIRDRREKRHRSHSRDRDREKREKDRSDRSDRHDRDREREKERRSERERERDRDREKERSERHRERERDKDRYSDRPSDRDRDRSDRHDRDRDRDYRSRRRAEAEEASPQPERIRSKKDSIVDVPKGGLSIMGAASGRNRDADGDEEMDAKSRDGRSETSSRRESERDRGCERRRESDMFIDDDRDRERRLERRRSPDVDRERSPAPRDRTPRDRYIDSPRRGSPPSRRREPRPIEGDTYIPGEPGSPPRPMAVERRVSHDRDEPGPPRNCTSPPPVRYAPMPEHSEDSELRSVFVSQLAARLTARDLGYFFEEKLGEGSVRDVRIVTDRVSRRSKGIAYVELSSIDMVSRAIALTGTIVMGLPIMVQLTESERNKVAASGSSMHLPPGVTAPPPGSMQLYVGSLHFNLTESDVKQVFEPFGELEFVDLHRDPLTGRSKGFAFVQYKRSEDARMALQSMDGFDLAGRQLKVNTVHEKGGAIRYQSQSDSLDESGGGNLNAASRQALMQKLARIEPPKPAISPMASLPKAAMQSRSVLLRNMFKEPELEEKENGPNWAKELTDDVKQECEDKYGLVDFIKLEPDSQGEMYLKFKSIEAASKAIEGLNGRYFGGQPIQATFISDAILQAHQ
ncbi:splicing factor CC1-like protein [Dacryopinax primogenitus]|uniref:Splicing factor CC1-like protein n=1 Tax=Dacryopinax primogenitus (strain DJM 731) TaxID=1858805 RepID=M5FRT7_DACPD|nr:splicing factor CC1-like protein [Dacryopinax primogenitus]EJT97754.1 splicing factor CC1-like protein [Dacryopinax primogenitus]